MSFENYTSLSGSHLRCCIRRRSVAKFLEIVRDIPRLISQTSYLYAVQLARKVKRGNDEGAGISNV